MVVDLIYYFYSITPNLSYEQIVIKIITKVIILVFFNPKLR